MIEFAKLCRLCLKNINNLISLKSYDTDSVLFSDKLKTVSEIHITENDCVPITICKICQVKLTQCYEFKLMCLHSNTQLYKYKSKLSEVDDTSTPKITVAPVYINVNIKKDGIEPSEEIISDPKIDEQSIDDFASDNEEPDEFDNSLNVDVEDECKIEILENIIKTESSPLPEFEHILVDEDDHLYINNLNATLFNQNNLSATENNTIDTLTELNLNIPSPTLNNSKPTQNICKPTENNLESKTKIVRLRNSSRLVYVDTTPVAKVTKVKGISIRNLDNPIMEKFTYYPVASKYFTSHCCDTCASNSVYLVECKENGHKIGAKLEKFKCVDCAKYFNSIASLIVHERIHSGVRPYKCDICAKLFTLKNGVQNHLLMHSNDRGFKCNLCAKTFKYRSCLQYHLKTHTSLRQYTCDICNKSFKLLVSLRKHQETHMAKTHACPLCNRLFHNKYSVKKHMVRHNTDIPYACDVCHQKFKRKLSADKHSSMHLPNIEKLGMQWCCQLCAMKNETIALVIAHQIQSHPTVNPYKCLKCDQTFTNSHLLREHMPVHESTYPCNYCDQSLPSQRSLKSHTRVVHSSKTHFNCNLCPREFLTLQGLGLHRRTHTVKLQCKYCVMSFKMRAKLNVHIKNEHPAGSEDSSEEDERNIDEFEERMILKQDLETFESTDIKIEDEKPVLLDL